MLKQVATVPEPSRRLDHLCDTSPLVPLAGLGLDAAAGFGGAMKQLQPREASPLYVWLTFLLIGLGALAYFTGYLVLEEIIAFFK